MSIFFRKPLPPFPTWHDAPLYKAQGYQPIHVEKSRADDGHETAREGPWAFGPIGAADLYADSNVVAILGARLPWPNGNTPMDDLRVTWIAFIRLDIHRNKKLAAACEVIVRSHVDGDSPVRVMQDSTALLLPFRIADVMGDSQRYTLRSAYVSVPGDSIHVNGGMGSSVSVSACGACFIADGGRFSWRDGRGLLQVPRSELPALSVDSARAIVSECQDALSIQAAA
jgi:hypothetical protein